MQGNRRQKGLTLIETLVGLAIFAVIGVALMSGLSTGYENVGISKERTYAESLAKSQVERVKSQDYISVMNYPTDGPYDVIDVPAHLAGAGYAVEMSPPEIAMPYDVSGFELQSITVKVKHHGATKLTITFYRTGLAF